MLYNFAVYKCDQESVNVTMYLLFSVFHKLVYSVNLTSSDSGVPGKIIDWDDPCLTGLTLAFNLTRSNSMQADSCIYETCNNAMASNM